MKLWKYQVTWPNIQLAVVGWISGVCLFAHCAETTSDIVIYGSSPAAISAAVQAKRMGKSAVVVSPESRIGGLTTGGLGQTDIGNKSAFGGIALEFYRDVAKWYAESAHWTRQTPEQYKPDGQTAGTMGKDSMWTFEPSAALAILEGWERRDGLDIRRGEWLDRDGGVTKEGGRIVSIKTLSGNVYRGKVFIDATYEGDLMAAAGVSYTVGREANSVYGETISGIQFREAKSHQLKWHVSAYVEEGNPESGLLPGIEPRNPNEKDGDGDKRVQAYCFRMCLTDDPVNRIPFKKPANYDEKEYELLFRNFAKGEGAVPWINSKMPNRKTDTNNRLGFSTDFIGRNYEWPEASYERRAEIFKAHLDYQKGLMWTLANDPRVPEKIRAEVSRWGTCRDEFLDGPGDGWQSQLYVREARRMVGEYVMTEHECRGDRVAPHPVAMGAYTMDSHNVRRVVTAMGNVQNEGDVQDRGRYSAWGPDADKRAKGGRMKPYGIDYGAICPKRGECENLLVPVCLSASHMAFGSIRMEPVFFALGQVAGTAASLAVGGPTSVPTVQDVPYATLAARLDADGQVMELKTSTPGRACAASVAPSAKFTDGMLSKTRPAGWLAEACKLQSEGLTGHPEALSYPYDTCLWAGEIPRMGKHGQDWWRYEQTAYYVDGLLRLGYATGDEAFIKKGEENIDYTLEHAAPDGHLGHPSLWDATRYKLKNGYDMWPLAVFFRAMKAKYDAAPDGRIPAALQRNFLNYDAEHVSKVRNIVNVEGLLWTYAHTGDKRLLDLAEEAWNLREPLPPEKKNELAPKNCANNDAIHMHGVSYCEEMKVPMILYAYTGKKEYLDQAVNVERKLVRDHMLPDGCPTSAERTLGNSVHVCHETCDAVDYTWSLGYFLEATGDAAYADRIEHCVFNAGFGAIAGDFKSLQYFSNVNQFIATSNSDHNPQNHGTTWMQYRPTHETECCAGNVNRILPNYISRMWLKDKDGGPVAALYGPSEVDFGWAKIKEETNYPFDGKVVFRFIMAEPKESAFTYRVPGWCKGASVKVNGEAVAAARPGSFATIGRRFADGDIIELDLPMDVCFEEVPRRFVVDGKDVAKRLVKRPAAKFANSSQGTVVTRGPLVFAYPIPTERTEDVEEHENMNGKKSANPDFKSWNLKPAGPFNYALAAHSAEVVMDSDTIKCVSSGFFKNPAGVKIRVSAKRIEWELDENRFTPDLPERPVVIGDGTETIELVPYGSTMLRLGVFPDVSQETFAATVWRGETAYVDIPAGVPVSRLVSQVKDGVSVALGYFDEVAYEMQPDGVDIRKRNDVYREDARRSPTVARVAVAPDAKPGVYNFGPFEVRVINRVLPPAKEWKYFLDLWQHPWAVSRYFNVEPFSKEHYAKMEPIWRALAGCGCKALTVTLLDLPWNHQCYDGYYSMVGRVRKADGTWVFDYKVFDEYVEFGRKCGLGPDIACYTMCPWKYNVTWKEEKCENVELCKYENMEVPNGVRTYVERREKFLPGTPEFEDYWGAFLVDFAAHLKEKGWFEDAYIAMDERGPEDVKKIVNLIQAKAPGLKVAICGKTKPSAFAGIQIENFCQGLIHLRDDFLPELAPRRAKGYKTTFYVCSSARHPNTFFESPGDESFYLGAYPVMVGFDGFLRWAANSWGEDPYKDGSFRTKDWKAGDVFLVYPNGELSSRLVELRAGIVAAEKMTILRTNGEKGAAFEKRMADIAKRYHFFASVRDPSFDFEGFRREVEALVNDTAVHGNDDRAQLYMAGDSIMAEYKSDMFPQYGWGQALKSFMKSPENLHNFARSGWSARRFRESGRWEKNIASQLKPGDWVIVSFGHNDMNKSRNKPPKNDYSTIEEYKAFLKGFAADAKSKGANIAFATSIAHSSGFSEKDGVMTVDGGATGLGPYVAAMREIAAELDAPLLDLNRYAEENLPKMGLEKAKALYMTIKPGEYANYPDGKNDPAHIRDAGAFFYAKGTVEMACAQNLTLAELFKDPSSVPFVPSVAPVTCARSQTFNAVSPDGLNEVRLEVGEKGMMYSVWRRGKAIVEPTELALKVGVSWLNGREVYVLGTEVKAEERKVEGTLETPIYKKSSINLAANETKVDFGDWAVRLHARNDGVAWRFETEFDAPGTPPSMLVPAESTTVRFPKGAELCYTVAPGFMSGWEKPAQIGPVESVPAGHPQIVMTPFTATVPGAGVVTVTESDLRDYPGLNFYRREGEQDTLRSWQAGVAKDVDKGRRKIKVVNREPYLAKTKGTRSFPWRVFVLGDTPSDLVASDAVFALATPTHSSTPNSQLTHSQLTHSPTLSFSWVKPGQVAWDWWNGFKITDVPGLKTGCNFETYKEYVNFAAANGIEYIIMDEGWSEKLNLEKPRDEVNVPGVIAYAKEKSVGVILWAAWSPLYDRETRLRVFDRYAAMGAKGFKIDFIERDDQDVERFLEETAADAAERKLVVLFHGIHKPTGLQRTYPNILNYEGVYGLEQGGRSGGRKVVISNDVNLVYTRMVTGFMDYTPGAMRNRAFDAPPYDKEKDTRACYGTRCHQLALFPLFEAPIQMLCDSPTQYRSEPECTAFITKVPTVWDATVGVAGEIGAFASVARRKGREWWLGAITNWERRELELSTKFLGEGEWKVDAFEDASDADVNAEHYVRREFTIKAGDPLKVRLAPGGGFAAKLSPASNGAVPVRVMTYNVRNSANDRNSRDNNWNGRREDFARLVEKVNPDVAGFQEVLPDQRKWLEERFPDYAFVGDGRNADRVNGESSPIAFRKDRFEAGKCGTFWLSETPDVPGSKSWNAAFPRICSYAVLKDRTTGKTFAFANTHTDHRSEAAREKGMLLVIERMKEFSNNAPVVFVGDHNCLEYEAPSVAVSKILKDAMYLSETPPEGSWRTFNYWSYKEKELSIVEALEKPVRERSEPGDKSDQKRIDYIYVSPGTRVLGYRTIPDTRPGVKLYPSDHFPSVAEIVIGATPAEPCVVEAPGSAKLVFDTSNAPDLRAWTEEKFAPAMCEWVVRLTEIMVSDGWEPPKEILFQFVFERLQSCTNAAAWASTWKNTVNLRVDWFRKNLDGEALGATVHELTHIMQGYWSKKGITNENCPSWASEGYADYIRWILFEPESDGCGYIRKNPKKYHYNDSYRVTAHFFGFVESCYPGTMKKLNAALRDHTFDNGKFWQDATGKPVETLEADWKASIK